MGLKEELQAIDEEQFAKVTEAVFDRLRLSNPEYRTMFQTTYDDYPAFERVIDYLMERFIDKRSGLSYEEQRGAVVSAAAIFLAFREYVEVQDMQEQFPDMADDPEEE
jgi:hypothetical protein